MSEVVVMQEPEAPELQMLIKSEWANVELANAVPTISIGLWNNPPLVTINTKTGEITYGPNYTPDAAAKVFWDAIRGPLQELAEENKRLREQLSKANRAAWDEPSNGFHASPNDQNV